MWNRTLVYLGLREEPDESYDELPERFVPEDDPHAEHAPPRPRDRVERSPARGSEPRSAARTAVLDDADGRREHNVRPLRTADVHVRPVEPTPLARVAVIDVQVFDDVEAVAARYRTSQPVLFDCGRADRATGRRVVDFVSGVTFALRGRLTKVGTAAFLLVPDGLELSNEERRRLGDLGYRIPSLPTRSAE